MLEQCEPNPDQNLMTISTMDVYSNLVLNVNLIHQFIIHSSIFSIARHEK